jgi:Predicted thioesterase
MRELHIGLLGKESVTVNDTNTAKSIGSGMLDVFATPAMVALMEKAAAASVEPCLDDEQGTVGIKVNIEHISATPVGMNVTAESELIEIDGKKLVFNVTAYDDKGIIGKGVHERVIINNIRFMEKTYQKI